MHCNCIALQSSFCNKFRFPPVCAEGVMYNIDFEIDTDSDDEDEMFLSSVLEKIDNELKEKYPGYLQKLTNLDFVKETSEAECSKSNFNEKGKYDNNDNVDVLSDSGDDEVHELEGELENPRKRKRKRNADPKKWLKNINKQKRLLGKVYQGRKLNKKTKKWDLVPCTERKQGEFCGNSRKKDSKRVSEDDSKKVFDHYWQSGSKDSQMTFVRSMVDVAPVKRKTSETNKRNVSRQYKLKISGNIYVCQKTFLVTLGISERCLRNALDAEGHDGVGILPVPLKTRNPTPSGGFRWILEDKDFLKKFFDDVPKTPYCRKDTQKLYLDVLISTKTKLYEIYKLRCSVFGMSPFSITLFNNYFKENNYSLFKPHKDQCNTCIGKDTGNVSEEVYNKHYELKCSALDQKECDKRDNDEITLVYCCDTEALLVSPRNNSNAMYYRTKLNIHNLTFYNLKTTRCSELHVG